MRVLIDSNIVISAILNPKGTPSRAFLKAVTYPYRGVLTNQNVEEIRRTFRRKFPSKIHLLEDAFSIALYAIDVVETPISIEREELKIRDESDRPIIRAAIASHVDIIITGDKDFLESNISALRIMSAAEFLDL